MKEYTETELKNKAEAFCSVAEHCPSEVATKLAQWGADDETAERIICHLIKEQYVDPTRYCKFFVRDKYRFTHWGRMKIKQALKFKGLSAEDIETGLEEIDEAEYDALLKGLLLKKKRSITGRNEYERNTKLIRFAVGRGYAMDEILRHVKGTEHDEYAE